MLNLGALAQDLNVPQLREIEISLFLGAINKEFQLGHLQSIIVRIQDLCNAERQQESYAQRSCQVTLTCAS